ncbi:Lon-like protease helical domain-containing protein [Psychrobacter sp. ENNN9_III]|uniref:Lon-like protease helical domain-containing protein n=1 Tax=Psychrobacter sp. ENNN9_III TaxID=1254334 RepID=UPI000A4A3F9F|nr:Lon-like protease helical domain-containing protein [Psychrobacter sp. ENNN9_III]
MTEQPTACTTQPSDDNELMTTTTVVTDPILAKVKNTEEKQDASSPHPIFRAVNQRCLITAKQLKRYSAADILPTDTRTAPDLDIGFGQKRALKALHTALDIKASGYHVFAAGENGLGKRTIISRFLQHIAMDAPTPDDWVYVHNFTDPRTPLAIRLPAGQAVLLQQQVSDLWTQAKKTP